MASANFRTMSSVFSLAGSSSGNPDMRRQLRRLYNPLYTDNHLLGTLANSEYPDEVPWNVGFHRGVATYTQKHKCVHIWSKTYVKILPQFCWMLDFTCTKCVRRSKVNPTKSNFDRICYDIVIGTL